MAVGQSTFHIRGYVRKYNSGQWRWSPCSSATRCLVYKHPRPAKRNILIGLNVPIVLENLPLEKMSSDCTWRTSRKTWEILKLESPLSKLEKDNHEKACFDLINCSCHLHAKLSISNSLCHHSETRADFCSKWCA